MSPKLLENYLSLRECGTLVLENNQSDYPMVRVSPFELKDVLEKDYDIQINKPGVEFFVNDYYSRIRINSGKEPHKAGCLQVLDILGKKDHGYVAWEPRIVRLGASCYAPDIVYSNGFEKIIEIQRTGRIYIKKSRVIRSMKKKNIRNAEISIGIPDKNECVKNLKKSLKEFNYLKHMISSVFVFQPSIQDFCNRAYAVEYGLQEFL